MLAELEAQAMRIETPCGTGRMVWRVWNPSGGAPVMLGREAIAVTASIGFATFPLQPARRPLAWERAIDLVDTAMYLAKAHGRNRAYGVRALHDDDGGTAQPGQLETAWRSGRAEIKPVVGPAPVAS